jgi:hypothetical protein
MKDVVILQIIASLKQAQQHMTSSGTAQNFEKMAEEWQKLL